MAIERFDIWPPAPLYFALLVVVVGIVALEELCCMRRGAALAYYDQCTSHEFLTFFVPLL